MSYKPLSQTVTDGKTAEVSSSDAVFDKIASDIAAIPPELPSSVAGDADKVLAVDAAGAKSWQYTGLGSNFNNIIIGKGKPSTLTGTNNIIIGFGTTGNSLGVSSNQIVIGNNSVGTTSGYSGNDIRIGNNISSGWTGLLIGHNAQGNNGPAGNGISIGNSSNSGSGGTAIGFSATAFGGIALGNNCVANGGEFGVMASKMLLGRGSTAQTSGFAVTIQTLFASGTNTDLSVGTLTLAAAQSTGNQTGGDVIIATSPAGSSGTIVNPHVERVRVTSTGNVGILTLPVEPLAVAGNTRIDSGNVILASTGNGLQIAEGDNATMGVTAAFPATNPNTITVPTTAVTADSRIFLTAQSSPGGHQPDLYISARTAGTSFDITSHSNSFDGTVAWMIVNPYTIDVDAASFITAAGITNQTQKEAVDRLVRQLKSKNLWSKMTAIYPFVGGTATAHSYNLKNTAQYQITWNGTVTHNANGITGNGVDGYGDTNLAGSTLNQNNQHLSIYARTVGSAAVTDIGAEIAGEEKGSFLCARRGPFPAAQDPARFALSSAPSNFIFNPQANFIIATRTASTSHQLYGNGELASSQNVNSEALTFPETLTICARKSGASVIEFSSRNYAFATIGSGLTLKETRELQIIVRAFQTTLGRQI